MSSLQNFTDNEPWFCLLSSTPYARVDSRQKLGQRESELMDGASKCREAMENQQADLRRQCSSLEQEVTTLKEDGKALQQQLREKVSVYM